MANEKKIHLDSTKVIQPTDHSSPVGYYSSDKRIVWVDSTPIVSVQQQRSEDEQDEHSRLFKDKHEGIIWNI